jgi:hypothetical protein
MGEKEYLEQMKYLIEIGFVPLHNKNIMGAKFEIGEKIKIKIDSSTAEITAINRISRKNFEYALKGHPFLYYEDELEKEK